MNVERVLLELMKILIDRTVYNYGTTRMQAMQENCQEQHMPCVQGRYNADVQGHYSHF